MTLTHTPIHPDLQRLANDQLGILSRRQLRSYGVTDSAVRWAIGRTWSFVLPGVIATSLEPLTAAQRLRAGALYAGRDAILTGPAGALLHGLRSRWIDDYPALTYDVPAIRSNRRSGFVTIRRTHRPDLAPRCIEGMMVATAARCVADSARLCRLANDAIALCIGALQNRIVSEKALYAELLAGPMQHSAALRQAIKETKAGAWSIRESDLLRALATSTVLPPVMPNPILSAHGERLPTPDAWIDDVGLAIQLHSREYHARDADWEGTVMSDGALVAHGITVIGVTPNQISRAPALFVAQVDAAYLALLARGGRPDVQAIDRYPLPID